MANTMHDNQKVKLENDYILVDSDLFYNVSYAINRDGKGMHIIWNKTEIPVEAENVMKFIKEIQEVWETMRVRKGA